MFETENQLLATFDASIRHSEFWIGSPGRRTFLMEEVEGMHGRVDRMMVSVPSALRPAPEKSELLQQEACCRIIVTLRAKQPKTVDQLALDCGRSRETIRYWLGRMIEANMVRLIGNDGFILGKESELPGCEIWCFEGKLRNWKRALYQATRYRAFAHRSFVVMPDNLVHTAANQVDLFRLARVGLISLDSHGVFRVVTKPRFHQPRSPIMFTMAQGRAYSSMA